MKALKVAIFIKYTFLAGEGRYCHQSSCSSVGFWGNRVPQVPFCWKLNLVCILCLGLSRFLSFWVKIALTDKSYPCQNMLFGAFLSLVLQITFWFIRWSVLHMVVQRHPATSQSLSMVPTKWWVLYPSVQILVIFCQSCPNSAVSPLGECDSQERVKHHQCRIFVFLT